MQIEADDYAILTHNRKPKLALILNTKSHQAVLVSTLDSDEPEHIKYSEDDLVANLGPKPAVGKVHGVHVEPVRKQAEKPYGLLVFYKKLDKKESKALKSALSWMYEYLSGLNIQNAMPISRIEVRNKRSKMPGMYTLKRGKTGDATDRVELYCPDYNDAEYLKYVAGHLTGQAVWYKLVPEELKSNWIELYNDRISVDKFSEKQLTTLLNDVMSYEGGIQAYAREIAEDDIRALIKEVYAYFKRTFKLDRKDIEMLMDNSSSFGDKWPTAASLGRTTGVDLGTLAMTKPSIMFCEAFAFHAQGKKLPKDCRKLMERTLKRVSHGD